MPGGIVLIDVGLTEISNQARLKHNSLYLELDWPELSSSFGYNV